eukprot:560272-Amphidinium_carterae.1
MADALSAKQSPKQHSLCGQEGRDERPVLPSGRSSGESTTDTASSPSPPEAVFSFTQTFKFQAKPLKQTAR